MSKLAKIADRTIERSTNQVVTYYEEGDVHDIVKVILAGDKMSRKFTAKFSRFLRGKDDYESAGNVWRFVRKNIRYIRDTPGNEVVKSPGKTWQDRNGDCKSHAIFVGSLLKNLGIEYRYRVAFYDSKHPEQGHIYAVARIGGHDVPVDTVHTRFDDEVTYWRAMDYHPETGNRVAAVAGPPPSRGWAGLAAIGIIAAGLLLLGKEKKCHNGENNLHTWSAEG